MSTRTATMSVAIQVLLCFTLTLIQQGSCNITYIWVYNNPTIAYKTENSAMPWIRRGSGESANRRNDYIYPSGAASGYKVHTRAVVWPKARRICADEGGHLAIINSVAEANMVTEIFNKSEPIIGTPWPDAASIGFHCLFEPDVQYVTIHDQTLEKAGYNQWFPGEPFVDGTQHYGCIHKNGQLDNHRATTPFGFICELPIH
ncbi:hemolymph lipopolysaccharide-binding protein-like isoform X1 [Neodiprion virginianus]|uniref:hemolymph lipopolysaccharide-binding protein-like isoform X1 n=1 Tax=Neodiprion virginianus TaxID=2961670 RepID=UPI001EE711D4|nr:hemolymph lipopolysaccharide-binding protein-like isoform X1 [Neodiprion virginianus]